MKPLALVFAALSLALVPTAIAHADPILTGSTVNGGLYLNSSPVNHFASDNPQIVDPGVEFSYTGTVVTESANFGAAGVLFSSSCSAACGLAPTITERFIDTAFYGDYIAVANAGNNLGASYNLVGDVLTISYDPSTLGTGTTYSTFIIAPTPEPGSLTLLGTGLLGVVGFVRRRSLSKR